MNKEISWIFELTLAPDTLNDLKVLMAELVKSTQDNEPDTLAYEWTLTEDESKCHIYEKYKSSEAAIKHLDTFVNNFASRLMNLGEATYFVVYGSPSSELKESLKGFNGTYMNPIGGFSR